MPVQSKLLIKIKQIECSVQRFWLNADIFIWAPYVMFRSNCDWSSCLYNRLPTTDRKPTPLYLELFTFFVKSMLPVSSSICVKVSAKVTFRSHFISVLTVLNSAGFCSSTFCKSHLVKLELVSRRNFPSYSEKKGWQRFRGFLYGLPSFSFPLHHLSKGKKYIKLVNKIDRGVLSLLDSILLIFIAHCEAK